MKVDVLVEIHQGVLEGVRVLSHEEAEVVWRQWADKHGYKSYEEFLEAVENKLQNISPLQRDNTIPQNKGYPTRQRKTGTQKRSEHSNLHPP